MIIKISTMGAGAGFLVDDSWHQQVGVRGGSRVGYGMPAKEGMEVLNGKISLIKIGPATFLFPNREGNCVMVIFSSNYS